MPAAPNAVVGAARAARNASKSTAFRISAGYSRPVNTMRSFRYVLVTPGVPPRLRAKPGVAKEPAMSNEKGVYLQTNDADKNEIVAFRRADDGSLEKLGTYETGGRGTGKPHLPSQSSIVVAGDGSVLVTNGGSDVVSL